MKKRISEILLCMTLTAFNFTGCGNKPDSVKVSTNGATEQSPDISKVSPQLSTTLHFDGSNITIPCRFSELGDVELDTSMLIPADDNDVYGAIYKDDERIGRVRLKDFDMDDENVNDNVVTYLELNPDMGFNGIDFTYQGFTHATSKEQIIEAFGTPDEEYNNNVRYYLNNDGYIEIEFIKEFSEIESIKIKSGE